MTHFPWCFAASMVCFQGCEHALCYVFHQKIQDNRLPEDCKQGFRWPSESECPPCEAWRTSFRKAPFGTLQKQKPVKRLWLTWQKKSYLNSSRGEPFSLTWPFSNNRILSESMIVCIRWAMVNTVHLMKVDRIVFWTKPSVPWSTLDVASSNTKIYAGKSFMLIIINDIENKPGPTKHSIPWCSWGALWQYREAASAPHSCLNLPLWFDCQGHSAVQNSMTIWDCFAQIKSLSPNL